MDPVESETSRGGDEDRAPPGSEKPSDQAELTTPSSDGWAANERAESEVSHGHGQEVATRHDFLACDAGLPIHGGVGIAGDDGRLFLGRCRGPWLRPADGRRRW